MENKVKKAIIKKIELYSTILMLATTPIVFTGCSVSETPQTIEIETDSKIDEVVGSNEVSSNTISSNTISENNVVSSNTISENKVKEESFNEEQVNINDYMKDKKMINYYNNKATPEQREIIQLGFSRFINNMDSELGIYSSKFDFETAYGGKYKDVNQVEFQEYYNRGYMFGIMETIGLSSGVTYIGISDTSTMSDVSFHQGCYAPVDSLSIISLNDDELNRYYIIKDYQGEEVIEANKYISMVTNRPIDFELSNFSVTPVRDYLNKAVDYSIDDSMIKFSFDTFNESQYYNKSKSK